MNIDFKKYRICIPCIRQIQKSMILKNIEYLFHVINIKILIIFIKI